MRSIAPALRAMVALACLWLISTSALAQAAPECLKHEVKAGTTQITNTCNEPITVPYCSTGKPIWKQTCGQAVSKKNAYYTHLTNLKPGEKTEHYGYPDIKSAPCRGTFQTYDLMGFKSDASGGYTCPNAANAKANARATATGATPANACAIAREMLPVEGRSTGPCECKPIGSGKLHYCIAYGSIKVETSQISILKQFIREMTKCDPVKDKHECVRRKYVATGVRG